MEYYAKSQNPQGHQETVRRLALQMPQDWKGWYMILESIPRRFRMCGKANKQALTMR